MSEQKPVWRMNTGRDIPIDLGGKIIYGDGEVLQADLIDIGLIEIWLLDDIVNLNVIAYETTRTKPAKYRKSKGA